MNYYNDSDPFVCRWLRNLIDARLITDGVVDNRSILEVQPDDVRDFTQVHLFCGIAGWPLALKLAGWPNDRPIWTGSCPCQPFSVAGKRQGTADARHLWPEMYRLVGECGPATVVGEQVASKHGRVWLAGVRADLEALGYAVGAADLCAAGVGAPHIRQRLYWGAYRLAHDDDEQRNRSGHTGTRGRAESADSGSAIGLANDDEPNVFVREEAQWNAKLGGRSTASGMGDDDDAGLERWGGSTECAGELLAGPSGLGFWDQYGIIPCADGKVRRIESGTFPLAHGVSARVGKLRAYGNAIVPPLAAEFLKAFMDCQP